ncbi:MAG: LuxR C-terminal-related transcriptional regulator [Streptosporangiaceae bacterium]
MKHSGNGRGAGLRLLKAQDGPMRAAGPEPADADVATAGRTSSLHFLLSSFVGRAAELDRAAQLLAQCRLLTLTGTGGCGKTRLAVELATRQEAECAHGAWFVDLAPVGQELVLGEIAAAIGVAEPEHGRPVADEIARHLDAGSSLIVLDNCEHVIDAAGVAVTMLLRGSADLKVIATSREPLLVPGEVNWTVPGMSADDALALFVERARQARPDICFDDRQLALVRRICNRLDDLPLAVELAAARTNALSLSQIAASLDKHFALLDNGRRTAPARQATLRASFGWSYDLLPDGERTLLRQLAVFTGGFALDDAIAVCPDASIETLAGLVSRSLVIMRAGQRDEPRYRLPETIKAFAAEHLDDVPGEARWIRRAHCERYLALAETAEPELTSRAQDEWLARLAVEHDNLRAALTWSRDEPAPEQCARLAVALTPYWLERSQWGECGLWLKAAAGVGPIPARLRARVLNRRCYLEMWAGDESAVPALATESLDLLEGLHDPVEEGRARGFMGVVMAFAVGPQAARTQLEQAFGLLRAGGDHWGLAMGLAYFADACLLQAAPDESRRMLDEAIEIATAAGDRRTLRLAQAFAAFAAVTQGRIDEAILRSGRTADDARRVGHASPLIVGLLILSWARLLQGRTDEARTAAEECLAVARTSQESPVLEGLALWVQAAALADVDPGRAMPLLAEARALTAGDRIFASLPVLTTGEASLAAGDRTAAASAAAEAADLASGAGCIWILGRVWLLRARLAQDAMTAESHVHEGVSHARAAGDILGLIHALELLAALAADRGDRSEAMRLRAAASAARARLGCAATAAAHAAVAREPGLPHGQRPAGTSLMPGTLTSEHARPVWAEGDQLSIEDALAYASRGRGRRRRPAAGWPSLTPTELEVVRLVARHQSNPDIAERLFISRATVKTHLTHIFTKLGIRSRSELAAEAIRRGLN